MALAGDKHVDSSSGDLILAGRSKGPISSAVSTPSHKNVISESLNIQQSDPRETQPHTPSYDTQSNFTLNGFI
ncbi:hypothetical protein HanPI659440_Chr08g0293271 [Helianthus annuus]|nr:hypothetical protein HanPI659440_Chr08g0293271 [Helianthus annuus]